MLLKKNWMISGKIVKLNKDQLRYRLDGHCFMANRKYFKTKREATKECMYRNTERMCQDLEVFKMPKGTKHAGEYAVCTYMEYLNTY